MGQSYPIAGWPTAFRAAGPDDARTFSSPPASPPVTRQPPHLHRKEPAMTSTHRTLKTALAGLLTVAALGLTAGSASAGTPWYSDSRKDSVAGADIHRVRVMLGERLRV